MEATMLRKSPNGLICRMTLPLNTTMPTPIRAIKEPIIMFLRKGSLQNQCMNKAVKIGVVQTNKATFEACVIPRAVFSAMKYKVPPVRPANINNPSSFQLSAQIFLWDTIKIHT